MALDRVHLSFDRNKRNGSLIFLLFKHEAIERARKAGQGTISGSVAQNEVRPAMKSFAQSKKRKKERKKERKKMDRYYAKIISMQSSIGVVRPCAFSLSFPMSPVVSKQQQQQQAKRNQVLSFFSLHSTLSCGPNLPLGGIQLSRRHDSSSSSSSLLAPCVRVSVCVLRRVSPEIWGPKTLWAAWCGTQE